MGELTRSGTDPALELPDIPVDDGLAIDEAGSWDSRQTVVRKYDPAFGTACQSRGELVLRGRPGWVGRQPHHEEGGRLVWGSPIVALRSRPALARRLFLEQDDAKAAALGRMLVWSEVDVEVPSLPPELMGAIAHQGGGRVLSSWVRVVPSKLQRVFRSRANLPSIVIASSS